jgi:hypothetical protein
MRSMRENAGQSLRIDRINEAARSGRAWALQFATLSRGKRRSRDAGAVLPAPCAKAHGYLRKHRSAIRILAALSGCRGTRELLFHTTSSRSNAQLRQVSSKLHLLSSGLKLPVFSGNNEQHPIDFEGQLFETWLFQGTAKESLFSHQMLKILA